MARRIRILPSRSAKKSPFPVVCVGLDELRARVAIVPQEPTLFKGSLRYNLDPFDEHDDAAVRAVLQTVQLDDDTGGAAGALDATATPAPAAPAEGDADADADALLPRESRASSKAAAAMPLDKELAEFGGNLSVSGQRQLASAPTVTLSFYETRSSRAILISRLAGRPAPARLPRARAAARLAAPPDGRGESAAVTRITHHKDLASDPLRCNYHVRASS